MMIALFISSVLMVLGWVLVVFKTWEIDELQREVERLTRTLSMKASAKPSSIAPFPVIDFPDEPKWLPNDAAAWRQFLSGAAGDKLKLVLNWQEQACNRSAVLRREGFERNCGYAAGWSEASRYFIYQLSEVQPVPTAEMDESTDAEDAASERETEASQSMG